MTTFEVNDMTCGHCVDTITEAIKAVDRAATVDIDLGKHLVHIKSNAQAEELTDAIKAAGYSPMLAQRTEPVSHAPSKSGGCCGSRG